MGRSISLAVRYRIRVSLDPPRLQDRLRTPSEVLPLQPTHGESLLASTNAVRQKHFEALLQVRATGEGRRNHGCWHEHPTAIDACSPSFVVVGYRTTVEVSLVCFWHGSAGCLCLLLLFRGENFSQIQRPNGDEARDTLLCACFCLAFGRGINCC